MTLRPRLMAAAVVTAALLVTILLALQLSGSANAATACSNPQLPVTSEFDGTSTVAGVSSMPCSGQTHRVCIQRWTASGWSAGYDCADNKLWYGNMYLSAQSTQCVKGPPYRSISKYGTEAVQAGASVVLCQ